MLEASETNAKISTKTIRGVYEEILPSTSYQATVPLIYEASLPSYDFTTIKDEEDSKHPTMILIEAIINEVKGMFKINSAEEIRETEEVENQNRKRRSLDFIADFSKWCCGIATAKSLDEVFSTEERIGEFTRHRQLDTERTTWTEKYLETQ